MVATCYTGGLFKSCISSIFPFSFCTGWISLLQPKRLVYSSTAGKKNSGRTSQYDMVSTSLIFFSIIWLAWKIINISCKKSFPPIKVSKNLPWRWQAIVLLLFRRYCWITFSSWNSIFTHYLSSKKSSFSKMCHNGICWSVIFNWKIHVEIKFMKLEFLI